MASSAASAESWLEVAPIRIRDRGFVVGVLQAVQPWEDEILTVIGGVRVLLPQDLEGVLRGLEGQKVVVACVAGEWRAAILRAGRRG